MPTSKLELTPVIVNMAWEVAPTTILDVGPGYGKMGLLCREYLEKPLVIDAVEMEPRYVTERLTAIYDHVNVKDVTQLRPELLAQYDLVLLIDVIEHLEKPDGLRLLESITGNVIVSTPRDFFQNPECEEYPSECHRSHWTLDDFGGRIDRDESSEVHGITLVRLHARRGHSGVDYLGNAWEEAALDSDDVRQNAVSPLPDYENSGEASATVVRDLAADCLKVLEFGCADGRVTKHLASRFDTVFACDISQAMLDKLNERGFKNVMPVLTNGTDIGGILDLRGERILLYSDSVLLHNAKHDVRSIFRSMRSIVSDGTSFVFQLPCYDVGCEPDGWTSVGVWTPKELKVLAASTGWRIENIAHNPGAFSFEAIGARHAEFHVFVAA